MTSLYPGLLRRAMLVFGLSLVLGGSAVSAQAHQGKLSGRVTDSTTSAAVDAARVLITGTTLIATTDRNGHYAFDEVPSGDYQVRVLRIGYHPAVQRVSVADDQTATLDFVLTPGALQLDQVVVTATGEQRKLEVGNAVTTIDAARVMLNAPITEFGNLISGRAAGVQVLKSGGTTGEGTRIRIRGSNSISLSNEPLYYIDGIRMESDATSSTLDIGGLGQGLGAGPSRINDIDPSEIESVEIVKGPAAATLYGIQASNGVVRITTKRGIAGPARWSAFAEAGSVDDHNTYPLNYFGHDTTGSGLDPFCTLQAEIDGLCTQTSLERSSPLQNPASRPLKPGLRQQYGLSVSGGTDLATYYVSGGYENEIGVFRLPRAEADSIQALRGSVPDNQLRPNALERLNLRANLTSRLSQNADIAASLGYVSGNSRFVENDNSFLTITGSGEASFNPADVNRGWFFIPAELFAELAQQTIGRFTGGLTANWRPRGWLATHATVGYDVTDRTDIQFFPTGQVADLDVNRAGLLFDNRFQVSQTTVDLGASASYKFSPSIGGRTSVGAQFFRDLGQGSLATGRGLAPGSNTITGAGSTEARDTTVESRSVGTYVEQQASFNDRLFLTGGLRFDDNSAFGKNFKATGYPKASASWLVSDEPFFHVGAVNTFRVRGAYGASGQQPGTTDALRFLNPVAAKKNGIAETGVTFGSLGNPNLKPERSRELELGFDADALNNRVTLEFTYYNKTTTDALVLRDVAGSLGASSSQFINLGKIRNNGTEAAITVTPINKRNLVWDFTLSGSTTHNKIVSLGAGVKPILLGFYQRHVAGYPAGGLWARPISFSDANHNGLIEQNEVTIGDTAVFMGSALPTKEASLNTSVTLFDGRLRLGGQFDYRGGHTVDNSIEQFRCSAAVLDCRGEYDRTASLKEQAYAQAVIIGPSNEIGFFEPGWFIKLRELSITYAMPERVARVFRANEVFLTLTARNLMTITDYSGVDPEVNGFGQDNFSTTDFESQPQVRYFIARVSLNF